MLQGDAFAAAAFTNDGGYLAFKYKSDLCNLRKVQIEEIIFLD